MGGSQTLGQLREMTALREQSAADGFIHLRSGLRDPFSTGKNSFSQDFRRGAGGSRAKVSDKIADREIGFVTNGGNNGNRGIEYRASHGFFVEGPQILEAPAATRE